MVGSILVVDVVIKIAFVLGLPLVRDGAVETSQDG